MLSLKKSTIRKNLLNTNVEDQTSNIYNQESLFEILEEIFSRF